MQAIKVQTTQNVHLYFTPASVGDRLLAYLIDYVVLIAWFLFALLVPVRLTEGMADYILYPIYIVCFLPFIFYDLLCELFFNGQSIGKKALSIRVMKLDGTKPSLKAYLLRWLFLLIDTRVFTPAVALVVISLGKKSQRIGDIVAGTTVVKISSQVSFDDINTTFEEDTYEPMFPEAGNLSDHDIQIIRNVLKKYAQTEEILMLAQAAERVKTVLAVSSSLQDEAFLRKIIDDYNHIHTH